MRSSREGPIPSDYGALIAELDDLRTRIATLEAPSGEAMGNALPRIAANVEELVLRTAITNESTYAVTAPIGTTLPYDTGLHAPVNFTIAEKRAVHFALSFFLSSTVANNGSLATDAYVKVTIRYEVENLETGVIESNTSPVGYAGGYNSGARSVAKFLQRSFFEDYKTLEAGSYTARVGATIDVLDGTGGALLMQYPRLAVQIGEKVA